MRYRILIDEEAHVALLYDVGAGVILFRVAIEAYRKNIGSYDQLMRSVNGISPEPQQEESPTRRSHFSR